ncbi:MAG TPA: hypothetical protein VFY39_07160 [Gammaproteobacteria bacterium]|nr:hypothetical protein [Gammaproteobacteria bacterium]
MKRRMMLWAVVTAAVLWAAGASAVEQGDAAPAWSGTDFSGHAITFPDLTRKVSRP